MVAQKTTLTQDLSHLNLDFLLCAPTERILFLTSEPNVMKVFIENLIQNRITQVMGFESCLPETTLFNFSRYAHYWQNCSLTMDHTLSNKKHSLLFTVLLTRETSLSLGIETVYM